MRGEGAANKEAEITRVVEGTCECVGSNLGIIKAEREKTKAKRGGRSEKGTSGEGPGKPTTQTSQTGQKGIERSKVGIRERGKGETVSELGLQGAVDEGESETGGEGRSEETLAEGGNSVVERGKVVGEVKCHSSVETKVLVRVVWGKEGDRRTPDAEAVLEERAEEGGMVREGGNQASGGATVESPSDSTLASIKGEATPIAVSENLGELVGKAGDGGSDQGKVVCKSRGREGGGLGVRGGGEAGGGITVAANGEPTK